MKRKTALTIFALGILALLLAAGPVSAKVKGVCNDCHTMHNSQNGAPMALNTDGTPDTTPNDTLLIYSECLGCHKGDADNTATNPWPKVYADTAPTVNPDGSFVDWTITAGGNFYWVENTADNCGHNIIATNQDDVLQSGGPPGYNNQYTPYNSATARFSGTWSQQQLSCAGVNGCHGTTDTDNQFGAIAGGHHSNVDGACDGTDLPHSYRFLYGIQGIEDSDWEYTKSQTDHNQYYGVDLTDTTILPTGEGQQTISYLCCECHGNFHVSDTDTTSASPWIRHPTDFDMARATGSEYQYYNEATNPAAAPYSLIAPGASDDAGETGGTIKSTVDVQNANGTAIVMCLSCHRAHGSPFADILRWDYQLIDAAGSTNGDQNEGCFICHTTKDDS